MKWIILMSALTLLSAQKPKLVMHTDLTDLNQMTLKNVAIAWEIPVKANGNHYYRYNTRSKLGFDSLDLVKDKNHGLIMMAFDADGDIYQSIYSDAENIKHHIDDATHWFGLQGMKDSYEALLELGKRLDNMDRVYGYLVHHGYHDRTLKMLTDAIENSSSIKEKSNLIFWIGKIPSQNALNYLDQVYLKTRSDKLKEKVIFAYYVNDKETAYKRLVFMAKNDTDHDMRKKAIFWLSQKAGEKVQELFNQIVYSDDDLKVRESAVFALYQMKDEASLKRIVKSSNDYRIRKKALFWLGQLGVSADYFDAIINN